MIAGGVITGTIENMFENKRYPVETEYNIIATCLNSFGYINKNQLSKNVSSYVCTLKRTMNDISYNEINDDQRKFQDIFSNNWQKCK